MRDEHGNPYGIFAISRNVTVFKRLETERLEMDRKLLHSQKLDSLGVLAGWIAHDFNNLLTVILGELELSLLTLPDDSKVIPKLRQAVTACQQAAILIRQMLAFSGKGYVELTFIDLNAIILENNALLRSSVSRNVHLTVDTREGLPLIKGDRGAAATGYNESHHKCLRVHRDRSRLHNGWDEYASQAQTDEG